MSNNDILRSLRYTFDFNDQQMINLFAQGGKTVDRPQVSNWLKRDEDEEFEGIYDIDLAAFLNGLIVEKRGVKEDGKPLKAEKTLSNNLVLRKLKIALNLQNEDMLAIIKEAGFNLSPHELSAFFRNPAQPQYRLCKDQVLRNFLKGLQLRFRN
ncbi:DUF1456 family protein [Penaeicola halotolerans]|uniref:DUF1456 family protein n=1 Tax=Penaeicola halotolerans TaxID=2793196 RepID=UPI001CF7FBF8|nr:DUF1456 family protein [Penaeicola halotolerans]